MPSLGRKFIIIGGAGLVGSAVARHLAQDGSAQVIICDQLGSSASGKWANLPSNMADLWTPDDLMTRLDKAWRDVAGVLCFADAGHSAGDMDGLFETSYHLPRRIWDYAVAKQRAIYWASSMHVYGAAKPDLSTDPHVIAGFQPKTAFGRAKQAFDYFAASQGTGPDAAPIATGFRLASVYGQGESHKGALASLPSRARAHALDERPLSVWDERRDWVHVDDAALLITQIVLQGHAGFFDIGSGALTSTQAIVKASEAATSKALAVEMRPAPANAHSLQTAAADLSALEKLDIACTFRTMETGLSLT
ncbi:NAD-dependent epimerase/dehydratase family protein [Aquidulcibacter sp.]|uniref:NAD-dependent epimerase/dehydratase family protein n=1 Tax=Aquidulcibacter sp. TaxID=2052990 RepID=UPI0025C00630|nr:NAD-dependent epimerase/dehydratase family protein [Aquidulcibacter sp.]MCA3692281.1 NAD-dependent epimerase/dehydratase family protein [Aquidulcibacter sp.]